MEALIEKCARLRRELEQAYTAWMRMSEFRATAPDTPVDISGCPDAAKMEWFEYLAARDRLVAAYAEQSNVA
jgi:hypothetical protein